jgi:hypothetical protein
MQDAVALRFTSDRTSGVGTTFDCETRVGPFRLNDRMTVTEWREGRAIGIRHDGAVTGVGRFTLKRKGLSSTRFTWEERLTFPWWLGGPVGGVMGGRVLRRVWRRNLAALAERFGGSGPAELTNSIATRQAAQETGA